MPPTALCTDPLLERRRAIVTGEAEAPDNETEEGRAAFPAGEEVPAGIPDFWLVALRNHPDLEDLASWRRSPPRGDASATSAASRCRPPLDFRCTPAPARSVRARGASRCAPPLGVQITEKDTEVLAFLTDVASEDVVDEDGDEAGFKLTFAFRENPFFTDRALTVTYLINQDSDYLSVRGIEGCKIHWNPDKDVTVKKMKKKPKPGSKAKALTKLEPVESFFRFFAEPPQASAAPPARLPCAAFTWALHWLHRRRGSFSQPAAAGVTPRPFVVGVGVGVLRRPARVISPPVAMRCAAWVQVPEQEDDEAEDEETEALHEAVEHHVGIGELIRERIIPHAVEWFTGE